MKQGAEFESMPQSRRTLLHPGHNLTADLAVRVLLGVDIHVPFAIGEFLGLSVRQRGRARGRTLETGDRNLRARIGARISGTVKCAAVAGPERPENSRVQVSSFVSEFQVMSAVPVPAELVGGTSSAAVSIAMNLVSSAKAGPPNARASNAAAAAV